MQITFALDNASANPVKTIGERTDEALLRAVAEGDKVALQALYGKHNVRVYRFVLRLTQDEALAEDIVSETFIEAWRGADRFKCNCQVSTWLLAIARNKAISARRRRAFAALDDNANAIEDLSDNPETTLDKKDHRALLQKCLTVLSPIHREIIDLVYYQSRSIQEVAEIVGIPINTVKTRMFCARNRLRQLLKVAGVNSAAYA